MNALLLHLAGPAAPPFPDLATALKVAGNARTELPEAEVEIVVQGPAVAQLIASAKDSVRIGELTGAGGVAISACANSLRSAGVDASDLANGVHVVPAAIAHLARLQRAGAAYVRV